jgi:hypothetical protein
MYGLQIYLGTGAIGKAASLGQVAIVQFQKFSSPGLQIRAQGQTRPAEGTEVFLNDARFKCLKSPVFQPYPILGLYFGSFFDPTRAFLYALNYFLE